jgi:hypothetical protein
MLHIAHTYAYIFRTYMREAELHIDIHLSKKRKELDIVGHTCIPGPWRQREEY